MMDEHYMRNWVAGHDQLSADISRGFSWLGATIRRAATAVRHPIGVRSPRTR